MGVAHSIYQPTGGLIVVMQLDDFVREGGFTDFEVLPPGGGVVVRGLVLGSK